MTRTLLALLAAVATASASEAAIIVTPVAPSVYSPDTAAMDAALGIAGLVIEDFEDTTLRAGLTYELDSAANPFTALPAVSLASGLATGSDFWDGPGLLLGNANNNLSSPGADAGEVTFRFAGGTTKVGIGMSSFQSIGSPSFQRTNHEFLINDVLIGRTEDLAGWSPGLGRNLYLLIDATLGDRVHSVTFRNLPGLSDVLVFDRVAFRPVPEPGGLASAAGAVAIAAGRRRRRRGGCANPNC